jgi:uroporphyrinogen III methyltransferase/synthase
VKLAAIGTATAARLSDFHLNADLVPGEEMNAEGLLAALSPLIAGKRVLLAAADRGREQIREELTRIAHLESVAVYVQADAVVPTSEVFNLLRRGEIDFVTLTSPNIARALLTACDATIIDRLRRGEVAMVTSNPRTSSTVKERGLPVAAESRDPTMEALIEALIALAAGRGNSEVNQLRAAETDT